MVDHSNLDRTYAALSDLTRRRLLEALCHGEARVSDLAGPFTMTLAGVSHHLVVLESAGLVQREVLGREHWLSLRPGGLFVAQQWLNDLSE